MPGVRVHHRPSQQLLETVNAIDNASGHVDRLSDHLLADLRSGGGGGFAAATLDRDGRAVAYAQLSAAGSVMLLEVVGAHDVRTARTLADSVLSAASWEGPVRWWVHHLPHPSRDAALDLGFSPERRLLEMERPLPIERTSGLAVRRFVPGVDEDEWLRVNNAAFAAHGEQSDWNADTLALRMAEPWFDPADVLIHDSPVSGSDERSMAGFCWTKVHPDRTPRTGEIYVIGVHPDHHGRGLGRRLTVAGLEHLAEVGCRRAMLYVDDHNLAALAIYRGLGFTTASIHEALIREPS